MNELDKKIYIERYNKRVDQYGLSSKSLGWGGGLERQYLRFKNLLEIGFQPGDSILDVGCGFADLLRYTIENGMRCTYTGIDINPTLIEMAKEKYPKANLQVLDILVEKLDVRYDWVFSSGIFNAKLESENNLVHIENMLKEMYARSINGIGVDFMSTFVDFQHPDAFHLSPCKAIEIAKGISPKVVLKMDYLPYEYSVFIKK